MEMAGELYRVVLYCSVSDRDLIAQLKQHLEEQLSLTDSTMERMFSGQPIAIQEAISLEEAKKYQEAIEAVGGVCDVETVATEREIDEYGFIERRQSERRSAEEGDEQRDGNDRRKCDRRNSDKDDAQEV